ncbi:MAG: phage portal protein [Bacteroidales bacterium]|jgi:hypothetical protein
MATIEEITDSSRPIKDIISDLQKKSIVIPPWSDLEKEYNPKKHPVMTDASYTDKTKKGVVEKVTRITVAMQKGAVGKMTQLAFGIPVKRVYKAKKPGEKKAAMIMENIFQRNHINNVNIERGKMLYAGCEVLTLWYSTQTPNNFYGEPCELKLRCKNYSPMNEESLYPLFDDYDDMISMSVGYVRDEGGSKVEYFETYTANKHYRWSKGDGDWVELVNEEITLEKISGIYIWRKTPIYEDTSNNVYEIEWTLSRNGNYIRKNSKPIFAVFADEEIDMDKEKDDDFKSVFQYPKGSDAKYIDWPQATESLRLQLENLYKAFYTQLQLPDMSFDAMKTVAMSGEARKMMFLDAQLKVVEEQGIWIEAFDREVNIIKAYMKIMFPKYANDIETLQVEQVITPYTINDEKEEVGNLSTATGGKPFMSQKEPVSRFGKAEDVEAEVQQLQTESQVSVFEPTV